MKIAKFERTSALTFKMHAMVEIISVLQMLAKTSLLSLSRRPCLRLRIANRQLARNRNSSYPHEILRKFRRRALLRRLLPHSYQLSPLLPQTEFLRLLLLYQPSRQLTLLAMRKLYRVLQPRGLISQMSKTLAITKNKRLVQAVIFILWHRQRWSVPSLMLSKDSFSSASIKLGFYGSFQFLWLMFSGPSRACLHCFLGGIGHLRSTIY